MNHKLVTGIILVTVVALPLTVKLWRGPKVKQVEVQKVSERTIRSSILASGTLTHENQVKLTAEVIARVKDIQVVEGETVKRGQILLTLERENFQADLDQTLANAELQQLSIRKQQTELKYLRRELRRKSRLAKNKLIDESQYDDIQRRVQVAAIELASAEERLVQARASVDKARDRLSKTIIRSPLDGMVTSLDIKVGETAIASTTNIAGSSLMTIADPGSMIGEINVDEADIDKIALNQEAKIYAVNAPDVALEGTVKSIASSAKTVRGRQGLSFAVKVAFKASTATRILRAGMSSRAEIFTGVSKKQLTVPLQATLDQGEDRTPKTYVYTIKDGRAHRVDVKTGDADDEYIVVLKGLSLGQSVVVGPAKILRSLRDGDAVAPIAA